MIHIENTLIEGLRKTVIALYGTAPSASQLQLQKTRKDFTGDYTVVVFPLLKLSRKSPEQTATELGNAMLSELDCIEEYNVIKGFLNLKIRVSTWLDVLDSVISDKTFGIRTAGKDSPSVMVEYSSPNTNKPLHLGHIRNNLLGYSVSRILEADGNRVVKVNLVNDRGIHICKSMLAWLKFGEKETPDSSGLKGDHLVGKYYVKFDQEYKKELQELQRAGMPLKEAEEKSLLLQEARDLLVKWENGDPEVKNLWQTMNGWVYEGFDKTYREMGVDFDKVYYESETYKLGKSLVQEGLESGVFQKKDDGSVWVNLEDEGLDSKLLLRSDGTSVYMTQDLGTANQRFSEFNLSKHIYVVGNEQNYHFQVLSKVLKKLGFSWAEKLYHLSYGMVELPEGKMKSREGTVVDADDLMDEMTTTAREMSDELGKLSELTADEKEEIYRQVGLGALKYFILKVDPKKNMTFNPAESVDFNGNTGPFIQYTYARIQSILRKAGGDIPGYSKDNLETPSEKEQNLIRILYSFPEQVRDAAKNLNPAILANYMYEVAREFNQFYHDYSILNAENEEARNFRLNLAFACSHVINKGMYLLGIEVPGRM